MRHLCAPPAKRAPRAVSQRASHPSACTPVPEAALPESAAMSAFKDVKNIGKMTKKEVIRLLEELTQEEVLSDYSAVELKDELRRLCKLHKEQSPLLKGLCSLKKKDLIDRGLQIGLTFSDHETRPVMMKKIRERVFLDRKAMPTDCVMIGKHKNHAYSQVWLTDRTDCEWVIKEIESKRPDDGEPSPFLSRFYQWLKTAPATERNSWTAALEDASRSASPVGRKGQGTASARAGSRRRQRSDSEEELKEDDKPVKTEQNDALLSLMKEMADKMVSMEKEIQDLRKGKSGGSSEDWDVEVIEAAAKKASAASGSKGK